MITAHRSFRGAPPSRSSWARRSVLLEPVQDEAFDRLARLCARVLATPMAGIGLIIDDRLLIKSQVGMDGVLGAGTEVPLGSTLCALAVSSRRPLVIADADDDPRVPAGSPAEALDARAYAAVPLIRSDGEVVGVLAAMDRRPRDWTDEDVDVLRDLSASVLREIEWRIDQNERVRAADLLRQNEERYRLMVEGGEQLFFYTADVDGRFDYVSPGVRYVLGYEPDALLGRMYHTVLGPGAGTDAERAGERAEHDGDPPPSCPLVVRHRDGRPVILEVVESALRRGDRVVGMQGLARDITDRRSAEEAVRRSERHFRSLIEHSADVIDILDADGTLRYVTPSITRILGYDPDELIGHSVLEIVHPADRERAREALENRVSDGRNTLELRVRHRDGRWRIFEAAARDLLHDPAVHGIVVTSRDVTARKEAAAVLQRNAAILAAIPDSVVVTDLAGVVTYWNEGATRLFGWTDEEMLGSDLVERLPADMRGRFTGESERVAAGEEIHGEYLSVRSNGDRFLTAMSVRPIRDESGAPTAILRIARDVTEQRLLGRVLEEMPEAVLCLDAEDRIISCNAAAVRTFGYAAEELIGQPIRILAPDPDHRPARPVPDILEITRREGGWTGEVVRRRKDGSHFPALLSTGVVRDAQGRVIGQAGLIRDLTGDKAKESGMRRAEKLTSLGTLLGGLAHELNNPLTSIKSFAQLLLLDDRNAEDRDGLEVIRQEADRAARLVTNLRLIARQTQESTPPHREAIDLNRLIGEVIESRRDTFEEAGIEVREDLTHDLSPVWGNRVRLEEMIRQLVLNAEQAIVAGPEPRRLIVRSRPSRRGVTLTVIDTGPGISPAHLERIFDPFWTTKAPGEGLGLGLSMAHTAVTEHGGEIRVESQVGRGSAFTVELPWTAEHADTAAPEPPAAERTFHILIVEDEAPIRQSLTRYLERRGHRVDAVEHGREALRRIDEGTDYHAIVSDLRMPGMGGGELFRHLAERGTGLERRMIFVTGDPGSLDAEPFTAASAVPVVTKPFLLDEIATVVEEHAAKC